MTLDSSWVETDIEVVVGDQTVAAHVRANWASIEVVLRSVWPGVGDTIHSAGFMRAAMVSHDPGQAYARDQALTPRGLDAASALVSDIHARCSAVAARMDDVRDQLDGFLREKSAAAAVADAAWIPFAQQRTESRAQLKAGTQSHPGHQDACKALDAHKEAIEQARDKAVADAEARFRQWCLSHLGVPIAPKFLEQWVSFIARQRAENPSSLPARPVG